VFWIEQAIAREYRSQMCSFLLASAITAFCQPARSLNCISQRLIGSFLLPATASTALARSVV
jgi:hypothetical protein